MKRVVVGILVASIAVAGCSMGSGKRLILGAGTSLVDSGFIDEVVARYEEATPGVTVSVVGLSSAQAIAYAKAGNADVILTHNPDLLRAFLGDTPEAVDVVAFSSSFVVLAPPGSALYGGSTDAALLSIASRGLQFVSRDDGSGTHAAELAAWESLGAYPGSESWYIRTGTGMGATLLVADQRGATTFSEYGSYLASRELISLVPVDGAISPNPYHATAVDAGGDPEATAFVAWLVSPAGANAITVANTNLFGEQVYQVP